MQKTSYYIINGITIYRLIAALVHVILIMTDNFEWFKWLLPVSFFTDLIDGLLARKFRVTSIVGSKLDSIADDLTIVAAFIGLIAFKLPFLKDQISWFSILLVLFLFQTIFAMIKYGKITSFHTYLAKTAAILQGSFLILILLLPQPLYLLFYISAIVTIIDLFEEIILVILLEKWEANVKGLYWVIKRKKELL